MEVFGLCFFPLCLSTPSPGEQKPNSSCPSLPRVLFSTFPPVLGGKFMSPAVRPMKLLAVGWVIGWFFSSRPPGHVKKGGGRQV